MTRRGFLHGCAAGAALAQPLDKTRRPPNIILLLTDQQRYDGYGAFGSRYMRTPNLDRLAREGCIFTNAHTPNPVCMAARHSLLTGLTSRFHGQTGNITQPIKDYRIPTMPRVLSELGYVTAAIGKMHYYPRREHHGFDEMHLMEELPDYRWEDAYLRWLKENGKGEVRHIHGVRPILYHLPQRAMVPEELHGSSFIATRSLQFIRENLTRPFFLFSSWIHPHPPFNIPETFEHHYRDADIPPAIRRKRQFPFVEEPSGWYGDNDNWKVLRRIRESYYSAISLVDKNVGRILDYLDQTGLTGNTIVIFSADHGEMLADLNLYQKALPYDASARVPMIVRFPGHIQPGTRREEYVDLLDIMPTTLHAAGSAGSIKLLGNSMLDVYNGKTKKKYQFCEYGARRNRWIMIRDSRYKYVYWYNGGTEEFYDMKNDPQELRNLIRNGDAPKSALDELRAECLRHESERGPEEYVKNGALVSLPAERFHPHINGKFPLWANTQWPHWGDLAPERERELMLREVRMVAAREPTVPPLHSVFDSEEWRETWLRRWQELGGDRRAYRELFRV